MVPENIYSKALSRLSDKDREAIKAYESAALEIQHQGTNDSTASIEGILGKVTGAKRALKHRDGEVGRLLNART